MSDTCDIGTHNGHKVKDRTTLYWVCQDCVAAARRNEKVTEVVEIERKRRVAPLVMPLAGMFVFLVMFSEILSYWH